MKYSYSLNKDWKSQGCKHGIAKKTPYNRRVSPEVSIGVLKILLTAAREPEKYFSFFKASHDWCWLNAKKGPPNPGEISLLFHRSQANIPIWVQCGPYMGSSLYAHVGNA